MVLMMFLYSKNLASSSSYQQQSLVVLVIIRKQYQTTDPSYSLQDDTLFSGGLINVVVILELSSTELSLSHSPSKKKFKKRSLNSRTLEDTSSYCSQSATVTQTNTSPIHGVTINTSTTFRRRKYLIVLMCNFGSIVP